MEASMESRSRLPEAFQSFVEVFDQNNKDCRFPAVDAGLSIEKTAGEEGRKICRAEELMSEGVVADHDADFSRESEER